MVTCQKPVDRFDGVHVGSGASWRGGRNAFVNFGQLRLELIEPQDPGTMGTHYLPDCVTAGAHRVLRAVSSLTGPSAVCRGPVHSLPCLVSLPSARLEPFPPQNILSVWSEVRDMRETRIRPDRWR